MSEVSEVSRRCRDVSRCVEMCRDVSLLCRGGERCRLTLVSLVSRCVNCVGPVSEGGLTVYMRGTCQSVDCVECRSVERVGACQACQGSVSSVSSVSRVLIMTRTEGEAECQVAAGSLGGSCCQASDRLMGELMGLGDGCR